MSSATALDDQNPARSQHLAIKTGKLINVLEDVETRLLPDLLRNADSWQSVFVDYEPPFVERLWTSVTVGDEPYRVFLHRIYPTALNRCLFHPHPWPSAIKILSGTYLMNCGYGRGMEPPPVAMQLKLVAGTSYEMAHPDGWHCVSPLGEPSCSLMVTGAPWTRPSHKPNKPLQPLAPEVARALLEFFRHTYDVES